MRKTDGFDMGKFGTQDSIEKTIAILGDRLWPQTAKQGGDMISKQLSCIVLKNVESPNIGGVSIWNTSGASS